ncbi:hypothetical protein F3Y22_tig00001425pilonHSYRG00001 [Hibiscus syriacus]|uniref:CID domain-containing protein n=1 Tax=Hibiscus syriacus TaxID=106335 RepID=A0A6A3CXX8_HIBSY|nr:hypothetical protein F3Y22_tig00001425pilonHSYRG00001 [Hibiscus syriacus]
MTESLTLKETPIPTKIARLMLVSDILHNSSAPVKNASAYRTKFEAILPDIMESFNDLYRSVTGWITAEALKVGTGSESVASMVRLVSFSDAYVNGLRATFLRSGNSGAAMKELMDLPLAELVRRCRHNGLSLVGGREIMVARLLSLEDAEKRRGYDLDDELKQRSSYSRCSSGQRGANIEAEAVGLSGRTRYAEDEISLQRKGSVPLTETLPIPQPELKAFTKKEKIDPVLPASKWSREDNDSDDEGKRSSQGLGLSYSSSGSENAGDGPSKADELDFGTEVNVPVLSESAMNEEQRKNIKRGEIGGMMCMTLQESGIGVKAKGARPMGKEWKQRDDHDRDRVNHYLPSTLLTRETNSMFLGSSALVSASISSFQLNISVGRMEELESPLWYQKRNGESLNMFGINIGSHRFLNFVPVTFSKGSSKSPPHEDEKSPNIVNEHQQGKEGA